MSTRYFQDGATDQSTTTEKTIKRKDNIKRNGMNSNDGVSVKKVVHKSKEEPTMNNKGSTSQKIPTRYYQSDMSEKNKDDEPTTTTRDDANGMNSGDGVTIKKVDHKTREKYMRKSLYSNKKSKNPYVKQQLLKMKLKKEFAVDKAVDHELLCQEEGGFLEPDDNEFTYQITQQEIREAVDITSATKSFDLTLDYGPYSLNYFRNGRNLLIGGRKGHVASFDWLTKELKCEFNVQESVHDVQFLHIPQMFAVAQKDWVYMYDDKGTELHCIKKLYRVQKMEFLPYHFLLATASDHGYLSWLDVSTGEMVTSHRMNIGPYNFSAMTQNPKNAIIHVGHDNGLVTLWSPNQATPLVKMLANPSRIRGLAIDDSGTYMTTAGVDRSLKLFDLRTYKCLYNYKLPKIPSTVAFSQKGLVAVGVGDVVHVYNDFTRRESTSPYMRHVAHVPINQTSFCPYEDVLAISYGHGLSSLLIPGSGEPNFDAFEANPFMTTSQKREMEVKSLLDKISPHLITLDPETLGRVNHEARKEDEHNQKMSVYKKVNRVELRNRTKGKKAKRSATKQVIRNQETLQKVRQIQHLEEKEVGKQIKSPTKSDPIDGTNQSDPSASIDVYSRFK